MTGLTEEQMSSMLMDIDIIKSRETEPMAILTTKQASIILRLGKSEAVTRKESVDAFDLSQAGGDIDIWSALIFRNLSHEPFGLTLRLAGKIVAGLLLKNEELESTLVVCRESLESFSVLYNADEGDYELPRRTDFMRANSALAIIRKLESE